MAGTVSAGTIVYEVDMDTARLLQGRRDIDDALNGLNGSMGRLEAGLNRTERSLSSIEGTMSSLTGVAKALIAALSVQQVGAYAQAWQDLSNKLANAVRDSVPPFETLADVTERVFDISQKTRSGLDATATLYARLERSTRSYGVSVEDITRLTTIINQGFVVSGSTAEEASNAIIQLAQGLASGALRGDEFNSVNEQGNRLMIALADSMNVSIGALRNMAAEGKLTTEVIVNGLLSQGDKIGQEFAKTTATISQSLEIANNNITKFFGENATVKTGVKVFSDTVISLSENLDILSTALTIVAGVMWGRYVGALTMATSAKIADIVASRQQVVADNQTAQAALVAANSVMRKALADKEAALSSLALAQAEYNVAKGSAAEMLAMDALVAAKTRATAVAIEYKLAEDAQAAASLRAAAASRAAAISIGNLVRGGLALIGGPVGFAVLAASAIFLLCQAAQQAKEEAIAFADGLDKLNSAMNAMGNTALRGSISDANVAIKGMDGAVADLTSEIAKLTKERDDYIQRGKQFGTTAEQGNGLLIKAAELTDRINQKTRDRSEIQDKLNRTTQTRDDMQVTLNNNMLTSMGVHDSLVEKGTTLELVQGAVAKAFGDTADEINRANQAGKSFDPKALQISPATKEGDKVIATLEEQNELLKIQDERARAIAKARMQAARVTDNQNQISAAGRLAAENYDLEKSEEARKKSQQESEQQGKKSASSAESVAQKLEKLRAQSDLTTESVEKRRIQEAGLREEQSLGSAATQQQLAEARALGEANEQAAISIQKRKEAEQGQKYAKQEIAAGNTSVNPITGASVDPLAQINLQETQKLEALAKYQELDKQNTQLYEDAKTAIQLQASNARMQIAQTEADQQRESVLSILGSASQGFDSLASIIVDSAGKSNAAYQVMFAASKAFAIAQSTLSLNTAIMQAMADPTALTPAQKLANYAAIASAGASLLSNVASISYGGGREHGGPVSANSMYRVGEGGKPEIYQANNGSQYMIPVTTVG
ncbi:tape measure protein [Enterobacter roggenkampii]|uniref:tape measure protein n=1 Tax=Enterobacter roggenkampii TaxID=1812935 RepID=UPI002542A69C|nr:tape measure protein [Enterobacter roggenkampii]WIJ81702.1 tape measure protein [Enterobacter roggenkampii]